MMKRCPNCQIEHDDNATFCASCGTLLEELKFDKGESNNLGKENKKPRKVLFVTTILLAMIIGASMIVFHISNLPQNLIKQGYFLAVPEVNEYDSIDFEFGSDLGFIFTEDTVFTTEQNVFNYSMNNDRIYLKNYYWVDEETSTEPDGTGIIASRSLESEYVFTGYYDDDNDYLVLSLTEYGYEFYDGKFDKDIEIVCKHFRDEEDDDIALEKMLYFDVWATIDYNYDVEKHIDNVRESETFYNNLFRTTLKSKSNDIQIYDFYKNYKEFDYSEGNGKITYFNNEKEKWVYKSIDYYISPFGGSSISVYQSDGSQQQFEYDEEQDCLVNIDDGTKIYRVAKFTDYEQ